MEESLYAIGQQDFKKLREEGAVYIRDAMYRRVEDTVIIKEFVWKK